jgi:hypothetical protein
MKQFSKALKSNMLISEIEILLALIYLITIPKAADESTSFAFGFSGMRFTVLLILGIGFTITAFLFFSIQRENPSGKRVIERFYQWSERKALLNLKSISFIGAIVSLYLVLKWLALDPSYEYQITLPRLLPLGFLSLILFTQFYLMLFFPKTPLHKINFVRFENWVDHSGISGRIISKDLILIAICLVIASIAGQVIKYFTPYYSYLDFLIVEFFLDSEMNIPTYFSAFILLFSAALLALEAGRNRKNKGAFVFQWYFLSIIFIYLAADEVIQIHEMLTEPMRALFHTSGAFFFAWYIPVIPLLILLGFYYLKFILALPNKQKIGYVISGSLYIMGVIGFEIIGSTFGHQYGLGNFPYTLIADLEEFTEMSGIILFIYFTWSLIQPQGQKPSLLKED